MCLLCSNFKIEENKLKESSQRCIFINYSSMSKSIALQLKDEKCDNWSRCVFFFEQQWINKIRGDT